MAGIKKTHHDVFALFVMEGRRFILVSQSRDLAKNATRSKNARPENHFDFILCSQIRKTNLPSFKDGNKESSRLF